MPEITPAQKLEFEEFVEKIASYRGRHTELVTVLIPADFNVNGVVKQLEGEKSTATNIKSRVTRNNVIEALEKIIRELKLGPMKYKNGLAIFCGNTSKEEGSPDIEFFTVTPIQPLKTRIYRCDQEFVVEPLKEMTQIQEVYGLLVIERKEATIGLLEGTRIKVIQKFTSGIPGKVRAGGQCHPYGTLIQLDNGKIEKIEDLKKGIIVKSIKNLKLDNINFVPSKIKAKWNTKKQELVKIKTYYPQLAIESSKEHVFFVFDNDKIIEKTAEELKKGDLLIMPEKIDIEGTQHKLDSKIYYNSFMITKKGRELIKKKRILKGLSQKQLAKAMNSVQTVVSYYEIGRQNARREFLYNLCKILGINFNEFIDKYTIPLHYRGTGVKLPNTLDKKFSQFLGYYMGDGCSEQDRITFFEQRKELALKYKEIYDKYFNIKSTYRFRESKNYHQLRFTSRPLVKLINSEFPEIKKTLDSEIPVKILTSKKEVLSGFLRGIFDAEGYVCSDCVGIALNNKTLIQQILLLLLRFSIIASFQEYDNKKNPYSNNPIFKIQINEKESLENFKSFIDFTSKDKSILLKKLIANKSNKSSVRQMLVTGKTIAKLIKKYGYSLKHFDKVSNFFQSKRMMSKSIFKSSILNYVDNADLYLELKKYIDIPLLPVKISKIETINQQIDMVDIETKNHNFLANGILVHNSAQRFHRITEGLAKDFFRRVAEAMKDEFFEMPRLKGILVGGPIPTKEEFLEEGQLVTALKSKVIAVKDIGYADEHGLKLLVEASQEDLAEQEIIKEKQLLEKFFNTLGKTPEKAPYKYPAVKKALEIGAVGILIFSKKAPKDKIKELSKIAVQMGSEIHFVSDETDEGGQFYNLGGIGAILRFVI